MHFFYRYVHRPLLYRSDKKFHFRCYSLMFGDGRAYVYPMCFILTAGLDYHTSSSSSSSATSSSSSSTNASSTSSSTNTNVSTPAEATAIEISDPEEFADVKRHITNLSVNKHMPHHPGQIPCHLPSEYPEVIFYFIHLI
jgi:hypothetical protein